MSITLTGAQWRAFMEDPESWPDGDTYIEEYLIEFRGEDVEDVDDSLVQDDDVLVIKNGWVRQPEEGCHIYASYDFVEWARASLERQSFVVVATRVDRDLAPAVLAEASKQGFKSKWPLAKLAKNPSKLTIAGADWTAYLKLEAPDWPKDGYVVDCIGKVGSRDVREDLDSVKVKPTDEVTIEGGAIVVDGTDGFDLIQHLSAWLRERNDTTIILRAKRDRVAELEDFLAGYDASIVSPETQAASPAP